MTATDVGGVQLTDQAQRSTKCKPLLAGAERSAGEWRAWDACNWACIAFAATMILPHRQPFHPSIWLQATVAAWSLMPYALAVWFAGCAPLQLYRLGGTRRLLALALPSVLLVACSAYTAHLEEHWPPGELGFLDLCVDWCPGPSASYCYHAPADPARRREKLASPNATAAAAVAWFQANVIGRADDATAAFVGGGSDTVELSSGERFTIVSPNRRVLLLALTGDASSLAEQTGWAVLRVPVHMHSAQPMVARRAAELNALATLLRQPGRYERVAVIGCSIGGKIAYWAVATAPLGLYSEAFLDSGGTLGPASTKVVGQCGETMAAMAGRWGHWVAAAARELPPPGEWPYDVGDAMLAACRHTRFAVGASKYNAWNNWEGTRETVEAAREAGCDVRLVEGYVAHCGFFFESTCAHSC